METGARYESESDLTMCNLGDSLPPATITIPGRWAGSTLTHAEAVAEVDRLAAILVKGTDALCGLYLRICDTIRLRKFTDDEIRETLSKYFPAPRVSEFVKIANAPDEVYRRYHAGFIGFRSALAECRSYTINSTHALKQKKIRRTAERLINLIGAGEVTVKGKRVTVGI